MKLNNLYKATAIALAVLSGQAAYAGNCSDNTKSGLIALDVGAYTVLGYIPQSVVGKKVPLVINLHATGGTGLRTLNESYQVAEDKGFVMISPSGVVGPTWGGWTWNVPGVPSFGSDTGPSSEVRDDVAFISDAIDAVEDTACIDSSRVYVVGFSGGARMASALACDLSERIASISPIGGIRFPLASDAALGLPESKDCKPGRAVPVHAIHGYWDSVNPWFNKDLGETPFKNDSDGSVIVATAPKQGSSWSYSGEEALNRWVKHNGCDSVPHITKLADGIEKRDYQNCTDNAGVSVVFYQGLGHAVPGHEEYWNIGQAESPFDGYALAWDLMKDDQLPK